MLTEPSTPGAASPFGEARKNLQAYVRQRLRRECEQHGRAAEIARAIGFSKPHISEVIRTENGPGDRLMHALASFWGMSFSQLEEAAKFDDANPTADGATAPPPAG